MAHTPETQKRAYAKVKAKRLQWFIENGPCSICESWENLELDHKDPSTKVSHRIWSWSDSRRLKELEKCQVLCETCHGIKTANECKELFTFSKDEIIHGQVSTYLQRGCRCNICKTNYSIWRANKYKRIGK